MTGPLEGVKPGALRDIGESFERAAGLLFESHAAAAEAEVQAALRAASRLSLEAGKPEKLPNDIVCCLELLRLSAKSLPPYKRNQLSTHLLGLQGADLRTLSAAQAQAVVATLASILEDLRKGG